MQNKQLVNVFNKRNYDKLNDVNLRITRCFKILNESKYAKNEKQSTYDNDIVSEINNVSMFISTQILLFINVNIKLIQ